MTPRTGWLKTLGTVALVATMALAAGCGKQRTKLNLNKTEKLLDKARTFDVEEHTQAKPRYDQALQMRTQAEQQMNANNFQDSVTNSREAVRAAKDALALAKEFEAGTQKSAADREVQVMNYNNGAEEDPTLYQEIIELRNKMQAKYDKQRWVATIELAQEIQQKVERLLLDLRRKANDDLLAVKAQFQRLIDEGGETHALIYVERVRDLISQIEENIASPTKNYRNAIALAKQAMIDAQEGIIETKKKKCEGKIEEIQGDLIHAQQLRAEIFAPELWNACSEDFAHLVENFWRKEYDFVLGAADRLQDQVEELIYTTRRNSANYQLERLDERVADLQNKHVEEHLPGRLGTVQEKYKDAQARFAAEEFEQVESVCREGQQLANGIMDDFQRLADDELQKGTTAHKRAQEIFSDMGRIFEDVPTHWGGKPHDQPLEDRKQAVKNDLAERLASQQARIATANEKYTGEDYHDTIMLMRAVEDDATSVIAMIYNVVSHNVITEISDEITRYDAEGAAQYAPEEMARTKQLLEEAKQLRDDGKFEEANSRAADARAELQRTISAIKVAASRAIENAQSELEKSNQTRTAQLRADDYQRALQYINEAQLQADGERLKDAIATANQAAELARQASRDAAKIWATRTLDEAQDRLADARVSGAGIYAATLLNEANETFAQAQTSFNAAQDLIGQKKFDEGRAKFLQAKEQALQAREGAVRAKFRLIDEADAAIVEARFYDAERTELGRLTDAILTLRAARQAMETDQYSRSHELAQSAAETARAITAVAKNENFQARVALVDNLIREATEAGGRYFNAPLLAALARDVEKLRVQYEAKRYDSGAQQLTAIESRLQTLVDQMPDLVNQWVGYQRDRLQNVAEGDLPPTYEQRIDEAEKYLRYAEMDFERGKVRISYRNLLHGRRLVDELVEDQAEIAYRRQVRTVLNDLNAAMEDFDHYLSIDPQTLKGMTRGAWGEKRFIAIAGKATPGDFRQRIDGLLVSLQTIEPPATMEAYHEDVVEMMAQARMAAIYFERLSILSEFEAKERREIIQKAYDLMETVRSRRAALETSLLPSSVAKQKI